MEPDAEDLVLGRPVSLRDGLVLAAHQVVWHRVRLR
jgi:hypothetical protein